MNTPQFKAIDELREELLLAANPSDAPAMEAYMKHHFHYMGLKSTPRRAVMRDWLPNAKDLDTNELVWALWGQPFREFQYCAIDLLEKRDRRPDRGQLALYEYLLTTHSWWDTIDPIATKIVGHFFKQHPDLVGPVTSRWMASDHMWLQRTCLLFQLKYKQDTDAALLESFITDLLDSPQFFIQKAIGWALRTYARTHPTWVIDLTARLPLKPLSLREATKHLPV